MLGFYCLKIDDLFSFLYSSHTAVGHGRQDVSGDKTEILQCN